MVRLLNADVRLVSSEESHGPPREVSGLSIKPPMSTRLPRSSRDQPTPDDGMVWGGFRIGGNWYSVCGALLPGSSLLGIYDAPAECSPRTTVDDAA